MYEYEYKSLAELQAQAEKHKLTLAGVIVHHEMEAAEESEAVIRQRMASRLAVFRESIDAGLSDTGTSVSGLVGGDADKMAHTEAKLLGSMARKAEVYALAVSEANAKMFKVVACPTAGSCGIVPAVPRVSGHLSPLRPGTAAEKCAAAPFQHHAGTALR